MSTNHVISIRCGYCKCVMQEGCADSKPCDDCLLDMLLDQPKIVWANCNVCSAAKPWFINSELAGWHKANSQVIEAYRYVAADKEFHVVLKGGRIYTHVGVPSHMYASFRSSKSKGHTYNKLIRKYSLKERVPSDRERQI